MRLIWTNLIGKRDFSQLIQQVGHHHADNQSDHRAQHAGADAASGHRNPCRRDHRSGGQCADGNVGGHFQHAPRMSAIIELCDNASRTRAAQSASDIHGAHEKHSAGRLRAMCPIR